MNSHFDSFKKLALSRFAFTVFLITKLPMAFFVGLKVVEFSNEHAAISVKHKWFNSNPFRSMYFAVLSMAAELSTGLICSAGIYKRKPAISMLVVKMDGFFYKKATGKIIFTCYDVRKIRSAIEQAAQTSEGITVTCNSKGINEAGELVANFNFEWSFKARKATL